MMCKSRFLAVIIGFGLALPGALGAQNVLEVRGGAVLADVSRYSYDTQFSAGLMAGIYYRELAQLGPFTLQPGIDFIQKGFKEDEYRLRIDYLELNLLLRLPLGEGFIRPFLKAGPYAGYAVGATEFIGDRRDAQAVNDFDFGGVVEGGITVNSLILGARASHGLAAIREAFDSDPRNFYVGIYAGILL